MGRHRTAQEKVELGEAARRLRSEGRSRAQIMVELRVGDDLLAQLLEGTQVPDRLRRPRAKDDVREAARELRRQGRTYDDIALDLGISKSSCSLWLRDLPAGLREVGDEPVEVSEPVPAVGPADPPDLARALRQDGALLREIAEQLGVSIKTVWLWCQGVPIPERARHGGDVEHVRRMSRARWDVTLAERDRERRQVKAAAAAALGAVTPRDLVVALAVSYWCEGAKDKPYDRREAVKWVNSDPGLVTLFLRGLHEVGVEPERITFRLLIHDTANEPAAKAWWAAHVGVPVESFAPTTYKRHNPETVRKNTGESYRGCLGIRLRQGRTLYQVLDGLVQGLVAGACQTGESAA